MHFGIKDWKKFFMQHRVSCGFAPFPNTNAPLKKVYSKIAVICLAFTMVYLVFHIVLRLRRFGIPTCNHDDTWFSYLPIFSAPVNLSTQSKFERGINIILTKSVLGRKINPFGKNIETNWLPFQDTVCHTILRKLLVAIHVSLRPFSKNK